MDKAYPVQRAYTCTNTQFVKYRKDEMYCQKKEKMRCGAIYQREDDTSVWAGEPTTDAINPTPTSGLTSISFALFRPESRSTRPRFDVLFDSQAATSAPLRRCLPRRLVCSVAHSFPCIPVCSSPRRSLPRSSLSTSCLGFCVLYRLAFARSAL